MRTLCPTGESDVVLADLQSSSIASLAVELADPRCEAQTLTLSLADPSDGDEAAALLAVALQHNRSLLKLCIYYSGIGDAGAGALALSLEENRTLQTLSLYANAVGDSGINALATALARNNTLWSLNLESNAVSAKGAIALASVMAQSNSTLERLNLTNNPIPADGIAALTKAHTWGILLLSPPPSERMRKKANTTKPDAARSLSRELAGVAKAKGGARRLSTEKAKGRQQQRAAGDAEAQEIVELRQLLESGPPSVRSRELSPCSTPSAQSTSRSSGSGRRRSCLRSSHSPTTTPCSHQQLSVRFCPSTRFPSQPESMPRWNNCLASIAALAVK